MSVIEVKELTKVFKIPKKEPGLGGAVKGLFRPQYESKTAVNGINFKLEAGEIVGYIGVNGAGKSTTIKMLTGVLMPTRRQHQGLGRDPHAQRVDNAREIGVVFGQRTQLWWDLALIESLNLIARIYDVHPVKYRLMLNEFTETLELNELLEYPRPQHVAGAEDALRAGGRPDPRAEGCLPGRADHRPGPDRQGAHPRVHPKANASPRA